MALVIGNKTNELTSNSGASSNTFSHTQDTGADGHLFIMCAIPSQYAVTGITYDGSAMTLVSSFITTTTSVYWTIWELDAPSTGANNVVASFGENIYAPVSYEAISFTGCSGAGVSGYTDTTSSPATTNLTISENSAIICTGLSGSNSGAGITIGGSSRTIDWSNNVYNWVFGGVSATGLSAGSTACSASANATIAVHAVEVKETVSTARRIFLVT